MNTTVLSYDSQMACIGWVLGNPSIHASADTTLTKSSMIVRLDQRDGARLSSLDRLWGISW